MTKTVLFTDLDHTLIEPMNGGIFPTFIGDMQFKKGILPALKSFVELNHTRFIFIVSNQGGIEKGYVREQAIIAKLNYVSFCVEDYISKVDLQVRYRFCKSISQGNRWRKPSTEMLKYLLWQYGLGDSKTGLAKAQMLYIGDASGSGQYDDTDAQTANNFNIDYMDVTDFLNKFISKTPNTN
jgi:DNA 3'-phosphatase